MGAGTGNVNCAGEAGKTANKGAAAAGCQACTAIENKGGEAITCTTPTNSQLGGNCAANYCKVAGVADTCVKATLNRPCGKAKAGEPPLRSSEAATATADS